MGGATGTGFEAGREAWLRRRRNAAMATAASTPITTTIAVSTVARHAV